MSTAVAILDELRQRGVEVRVDGSRLLFRPLDRVPPELLTQLRIRKAELMTILQAGDYWARRAAALLSNVTDPDVRADLRELFEHRAAVCEFDGNLSRTDAERVAFGELRAAMKESAGADGQHNRGVA